MFPKGTFLTKDDPLQTNPDKPTVAKKDGGLLRSSGVVSFFTMLSRVMGLARDVVLARVIGAEAFADVFFVPVIAMVLTENWKRLENFFFLNFIIFMKSRK